MSTLEATCADRNKTDLTRQVTTAAVTWLDVAGFKPVETEVSVADRWIADVAGAVIPTRTEAQRLRLLPSRPGWSRREQRAAWERKYEALPDTLTGVVEVKTTRADFLRDDKWARTRPADLCWLAAPKGLFELERYPAGWGVLEFADGELRAVRRAPLLPVSIESRMSLVLSVAMRRDNLTRYARMREWQRQARAANSDYVSCVRMSQACRAVMSIVHGEGASVDAVLDRLRIKGLSQWDREQFSPLWAIKPPRDDSVFRHAPGKAVRA